MLHMPIVRCLLLFLQGVSFKSNMLDFIVSKCLQVFSQTKASKSKSMYFFVFSMCSSLDYMYFARFLDY